MNRIRDLRQASCCADRKSSDQVNRPRGSTVNYNVYLNRHGTRVQGPTLRNAPSDPQ